MLTISNTVTIAPDEIELSAIRAQGAGGQNVNKVSSAVHLRFDIANSSLPEVYKTRLLASNDNRISREGVLILKAQQFRTQEQNKEDALRRLQEIIKQAGVVPKARRPTRPTKASQKRRIEKKKVQGQRKKLRGKIDF